TLLIFYFTQTPPTVTYTLSLHDALPICGRVRLFEQPRRRPPGPGGRDDQGADGVLLRAGRAAERGGVPGGRRPGGRDVPHPAQRSEEHTSELQSRGHLVCRLLLEKKNTS